MPTYEYLCTACDNHWEEVQKISEDALEVCPKCGKSTAKRQISGGNFILKGGGWYADLYSSSPKKSSGESSGESKPAASESKSKSEAPSPAPAAAPKESGGGSSGSSGGSSGSGGSGSSGTSGGSGSST
jgi:putative FmdB family regulatory protein